MTLGELYDAVAYLGFETELDGEVLRRGFYAVLGRALQTVDRLSPRTRRVTVSHIAPRAIEERKEPIRIPNGKEARFSLGEGSGVLVLSLFGTGRVIVSGGHGERELCFSSLGESRLAVPLSRENELVILAERDVVLGGFGQYEEVSPLGEILLGRGVFYDIRRLCPDFAGFASPCLYLDGKAYLGLYEIEGERIVLPEGSPSGLYEVACRLAMPTYSPFDDPSLELPLSPLLAPLLPELVASMIWLDDAPEKAAHYAALYRENELRVRAEMRRAGTLSVVSSNGW